jgi:hypothetical protein
MICHGYGEAGESGSASKVEECGVRAQMLGCEEAFAEMAANYLFGAPNGREIRSGVPLEKQVQIGGQLRIEGGGNCLCQ